MIPHEKVPDFTPQSLVPRSKYTPTSLRRHDPVHHLSQLDLLFLIEIAPAVTPPIWPESQVPYDSRANQFLSELVQVPYTSSL